MRSVSIANKLARSVAPERHESRVQSPPPRSSWLRICPSDALPRSFTFQQWSVIYLVKAWLEAFCAESLVWAVPGRNEELQPVASTRCTLLGVLALLNLNPLVSREWELATRPSCLPSSLTHPRGPNQVGHLLRELHAEVLHLDIESQPSRAQLTAW